jgi:hypothetical protein
MLLAVVGISGQRKRRRPSSATSSGRDLGRSVRKPNAPPARIEKPITAYDRRRRRRELDESDESLEDS